MLMKNEVCNTEGRETRKTMKIMITNFDFPNIFIHESSWDYKSKTSREDIFYYNDNTILMHLGVFICVHEIGVGLKRCKDEITLHTLEYIYE